MFAALIAGASSLMAWMMPLKVAATSGTHATAGTAHHSTANKTFHTHRAAQPCIGQHILQHSAYALEVVWGRAIHVGQHKLQSSYMNVLNQAPLRQPFTALQHLCE